MTYHTVVNKYFEAFILFGHPVTPIKHEVSACMRLLNPLKRDFVIKAEFWRLT